MKVMLVEDDQTMRALLKTLLEIEGFSVISCDQPTEECVISKIESEVPEAVFMDVNLRGTSGLDIAKKIRLLENGKSIRILMASGMDLSHECSQAGADGFLMKPYMPDDLITWLRTKKSS